MTFAERMDHVAEPEELERLMVQVRKRGSDNWTLASVKERVHEDLWPLLEDHFDDDGNILDWAETEPSTEDANVRVSILATVRALNAELRKAREGAARDHRERLEARRARAEAEAEVVDPEPGELPPEKPARDEPAVITVGSDAAPPPAVEEEESAPAVEKPPKRKRRLVKRPEDLKRRREEPRSPEERSDQAKTRSSKTEAGTPKPAAVPAENDRDPSAAPREMPRPIEPDPVPEAFASHTFVEGWCTECGINADRARETGWACETSDDNVSPEPPPPPTESGHTSTHRFEGDWCSRCGLGREQASKYPCND